MDVIEFLMQLIAYVRIWCRPSYPLPAVVCSQWDAMTVMWRFSIPLDALTFASVNFNVGLRRPVPYLVRSRGISAPMLPHTAKVSLSKLMVLTVTLQWTNYLAACLKYLTETLFSAVHYLVTSAH
jgi:hypothetical protein